MYKNPIIIKNGCRLQHKWPVHIVRDRTIRRGEAKKAIRGTETSWGLWIEDGQGLHSKQEGKPARPVKHEEAQLLICRGGSPVTDLRHLRNNEACKAFDTIVPRCTT